MMESNKKRKRIAELESEVAALREAVKEYRSLAEYWHRLFLKRQEANIHQPCPRKDMK